MLPSRKLCCILLSCAVSYWALLYPTELRCLLLSCAAFLKRSKASYQCKRHRKLRTKNNVFISRLCPSCTDLCHRVDRVLGFFSLVLRIGPPTPSPAGECVPLLHSGRRGWGSQFGRGDRLCGTLGIWVLCARNSFQTIFYAVKHKIGDFEGAKNFLTLKLSWAQRRTILGSEKSRPPRKTLWNHRFCVLLHKKWFRTNSSIFIFRGMVRNKITNF